MDQEAKYWRDKWLEVVRQVEALKELLGLKPKKRKRRVR